MSQPESDSTGGIFDPGAVDESVTRIRELNERIIESTRSAGQTSLDAYERALKSLAAFEELVATGTQVEWVSALAQAHAQFVQDVSGAYIRAARSMLE